MACLDDPLVWAQVKLIAAELLKPELPGAFPRTIGRAGWLIGKRSAAVSNNALADIPACQVASLETSGSSAWPARKAA